MKRLMFIFLALYVAEFASADAAQFFGIRVVRSALNHYPQAVRQSFQQATEFLESETKQKILDAQLRLLTDHLEEHIPHKIPSCQTKYLRKQFNHQRSKLMLEWSKNNNRPSTLVPFNRNLFEQNLSALTNEETEIHHIIFLSYQGVNEWWNLLPMSRSIHQKKIHAPNSAAENFLKQCDLFWQETKNRTDLFYVAKYFDAEQETYSNLPK